MRMLGCPIVDPQRDARGALRAAAEAARRQLHGLLVFPEGHRSRDGEMLPFRARGMGRCCASGRLPVYLVVERRALDARAASWTSLFNVDRDARRTEVLGPFLPPEDDAALDGVHRDAARADGGERPRRCAARRRAA